MNQDTVFETIPLAFDPEFESEEFEAENERGRRRPSTPSRVSYARSKAGLRPKRIRSPKAPRPRPISGRPRPRGAWGIIREPYSTAPFGSERVRWVQDCLNQVMGLQLPVNGIMSVETRSALRSFQQRQGLGESGILGPDTEQALASACRPGPASDTEVNPFAGDGALESEWRFEADTEFGDIFARIAGGLGSAYDRVVDAAGGATGSRIIDLTASSEKSNRKGSRDPKTVYALVLHQMACCANRKDPLKNYLKTKSHFVILRDGTLLQLHPVSALLWASNGFNARSVAVEFAGNFPNTLGKWWQGDKYGNNHPTQAQFEAGRYLVRYLMKTIKLTHVLAHRQSSGTRQNDPGPDIWSQVGQWAVDKLGLKDGGPGFKIGSGNPIPDAWRTWKSSSVTPEIGPEPEGEFTDTEIAHDLAEGETDSWNEYEFGQRITGALRRANVASPSFRDAGPLTSATVKTLKGPGLYVIKSQSKKPYVGQSTDLRTRLQQHLWCAEHLGVPSKNFRVFVAERPDIAKLGNKEKQRLALRSEERRINATLVPTGLVANKRAELELAPEQSVWN
ncbi:MAG: N-acetylmuramoyl-L-alanine amidase [Methylomicrobium sp.]|nr:N-acetylmuramoyl-L-alanine amidase [Methylomicrobium sp.]